MPALLVAVGSVHRGPGLRLMNGSGRCEAHADTRGTACDDSRSLDNATWSADSSAVARPCPRSRGPASALGQAASFQTMSTAREASRPWGSVLPALARSQPAAPPGRSCLLLRAGQVPRGPVMELPRLSLKSARGVWKHLHALKLPRIQDRFLFSLRKGCQLLQIWEAPCHSRDSKG